MYARVDNPENDIDWPTCILSWERGVKPNTYVLWAEGESDPDSHPFKMTTFKLTTGEIEEGAQTLFNLFRFEFKGADRTAASLLEDELLYSPKWEEGVRQVFSGIGEGWQTTYSVAPT